MTATRHSDARVNSVESADGTRIGYSSVGAGPGLLVVGGGGGALKRREVPTARRPAGEEF